MHAQNHVFTMFYTNDKELLQRRSTQQEIKSTIKYFFNKK